MNRIDSRVVGEGDVFFALPGERVSGEAFIEAALRAGAKEVVASMSAETDKRIMRVPSVLGELQRRAQLKLDELGPEIIGVTGSVGKTTTKNLIAAALEGDFQVFKSPGNANSQAGLPLSILNADLAGVDVCVLEMGMSERGEIERLVEMAPPTVGVVTAIGLSHAEGFDSVEAIAREKGMVFASDRLRKGFVGYQAREFFPEMEGAPFCTNPLEGNRALARCVARFFGVSDEVISERLEGCTGERGRMSDGEFCGAKVLDDSYNASRLSFEAAFQNLPKVRGRKIGIIGQMGELGEWAREEHEAVGKMASEHLDLAFLVGEETKVMEKFFVNMGKRVEWFADKNGLRERLEALLRPDDLVFLKGSNSNRLWEIIS